MRGSGTEGDPYLVATLEDLDNVRNDLTAHYKQVANIDASATRQWRWEESWEAYKGWEPVGTFSGVYDGGGHSISGLYIDDSNTHIGLFGQITNAIISNLTLYNPDIANRGFAWLPACSAGCIAGFINYSFSRDVEITSCHVVGGELKSRCPYVGGIVGDVSGGSSVYITSCTVRGLTVGAWESAYRVGGISGNSAKITDCHFDGDILTVNPAASMELIGGISGYGGTITRCSARGTIDAPGAETVGGICGSGTIVDCCAQMDITGGDKVGGLSGRASRITRCYFAGTISGDTNVAALTGEGTPSTVSSYWDADLTGVGSSVGEPKTTAEMMQAATFVNWDFVDIWAIHNGQTYPMHRRGPVDQGEPLTTRKAYLHVVAVDGPGAGSMLHEGQWYMYVKPLEAFPSEKHPAGTSITHTYGGDVVEYDGQGYQFLASGVQDPLAPGGYSQYTNETERTVQTLPDRANNVNFYYIIPGEIAELGYLELGIGGQTLLLPVADPDNPALLTNAVRVALPQGVGAAVMVPPDDPAASPLRIAVGDNIYAFRRA